MSRKRVGDRLSVRCTKLSPTPFLKKWLERLVYRGLVRGLDNVLDLGCGNGRNLRYLQDKGYKVTGIDMVGDIGMKVMLGHEKLPFKAETFEVILLNYVLMFLDKAERCQLYHEIDLVAKNNCVLFVEMYPAKDGHATTEEACEWMLGEMQNLLGKQWGVYQKSKLRRILWLKRNNKVKEKSYANNGSVRIL